MSDGRISLGLNPDGPTDRQIGLIRLERTDGSIIALIANYAMHGTALGPHNTLISGDAPGIVEAYVEEKLGAPLLYINGAAGNLAPIYTVQEDFRAAHITEFNVLLGDRILAANRSLAPARGEASIKEGERFVETPRRKGFGWDDSLGNYLKADRGDSGTIRFPIRFAIINEDLALWSAPVELFCEISMKVRSRSPYPHTFYFGYANGWLGYLATRQAFSEGGYETETNPFTGSGGRGFDRDGADVSRGSRAVGARGRPIDNRPAGWQRWQPAPLTSVCRGDRPPRCSASSGRVWRDSSFRPDCGRGSKPGKAGRGGA